MARTAPAPNIPPIPGMNPCTWVMGGGAGGGGGGAGKGGGGKGKGGGKGGKDSKDAEGGGKNSKASGDGSGAGCPNPSHGGSGTAAGDPIDLTTGRVYTLAAADLVLPGPLPFVLERTYDSFLRDRDVGLGAGWSHSLAWEVHVGRRRLKLTTGDGIAWNLPVPAVDDDVQVADLLVRREVAAFSVIVGSRGLTYRFEPATMPPRAPPAGEKAEPPTGRFLLTAVVDAYGNALRLRYDGVLLAGFVDSAGREVRVRRAQAQGRIAAFEVQSSASGGFVAFRTYQYDERGDLVAALDGYGAATRFSYDDQHRLVAQGLPEGMTTRYRYDSQGRCLETWCDTPAGDPALDQSAPATLRDGTTRARGFLHCKIERTEEYVEVVTSRSIRRYFLRDGMIEKAVFASGVHDSEYDSLGNLVRYVDPVEAEWSWSYDEHGRRTRERGPLGHVCEWIYDDRGHLVRTIYPTTVIDYVRNDQGDLLLASDALGQLVAYERDPRGLIVSARTPAGRTSMTYDSMGNRVLVREPNGAERRLEYDYLGQLVAMTDENGHVTRYRYGAGRELTTVFQADGSRIDYGYDRDGHLNAIHTPLGTYELAWGGYEVVHSVKRPNGSRLRFRYDREGALCRVLDDANQEHVLSRDDEGRVIEERTFDGRSASYRTDTLGRVTRVQDDHGGITQIQYDALGRIVQRTLPDDSIETFGYDWNGRVLSAKNGDVECLFEYDIRGRKRTESQDFAGHREEVLSEYGETERTLLRSSRGYEQRVSYTPTLRPEELRLPGCKEPVRFRWDGADQEVERALPGGAALHTTYDALGRLARRELTIPQASQDLPNLPQWGGKRPGLVVEQDVTYVFGTTLPQRLDDSLRGSIEFAHDPLGQVVARTPTSLAREQFSYEPFDNVFDGNLARDYAPGGRLLRRGMTEYRYDAGHRLIEKRVPDASGALAVWRYEWNAAGLMTASVSPEGQRVEHVYDAFGRRVQRRQLKDDVLVESVRFVWDGSVTLHELRAGTADASTVRERTYAYIPSSFALIAHRDSVHNGGRHDSDWVYYLSDNTGRPQALLDGNGAVLATYDHEAFGRAAPSPNAAPTARTNARSFGQWEDEETGLFYNRFRFYDPETGRYLSPEPLGLEGGLSPFGYARNRPFDYYDPDGRLGMWAGGSGIPPRGSASTEGIASSDLNLHPVVSGALANPSLANSWGAPRSPAACGEPRHLSDFLRSREPPPIDPNDHDRVRQELQDYKVQSTQANNSVKRAPCPNCSQMFANLMAKYGAPPEGNIGKGGTAWNSLPQNYTNFTPPPPGAAGQGPNGQAWTSYAQAMANYVPPPPAP